MYNEEYINNKSTAVYMKEWKCLIRAELRHWGAKGIEVQGSSNEI